VDEVDVLNDEDEGVGVGCDEKVLEVGGEQQVHYVSETMKDSLEFSCTVT